MVGAARAHVEDKLAVALGLVALTCLRGGGHDECLLGECDALGRQWR
jgi:hypothetical protein